VLAHPNLAEIPMHRKVASIPFGRRLAMLLGLAVIVAGLALFVSVVGAVSHDVHSPRLDAATIGLRNHSRFACFDGVSSSVGRTWRCVVIGRPAAHGGPP
jgi:hypothetical protein